MQVVHSYIAMQQSGRAKMNFDGVRIECYPVPARPTELQRQFYIFAQAVCVRVEYNLVSATNCVISNDGQIQPLPPLERRCKASKSNWPSRNQNRSNLELERQPDFHKFRSHLLRCVCESYSHSIACFMALLFR